VGAITLLKRDTRRLVREVAKVVEASTWREAAESVSATMNTGRDMMFDATVFIDFANERANAALPLESGDDDER